MEEANEITNRLAIEGLEQWCHLNSFMWEHWQHYGQVVINVKEVSE